MGKGRRNQRNVDYYKVQGGAVEDRDVGRAAKQKLSQKQTSGRRPRPEDVHPTAPRRIKPPARKKPAAQPRARKVQPEAHAPNTFAHAALSRLGGVTRRVFGLAESAVGALRWAGHMIQTARGRSTEE